MFLLLVFIALKGSFN